MFNPNPSIRSFIIAAAAILLSAVPSQTGRAQLAALRSDSRPTLAPLIGRVTPGVVNIAVVSTTSIAPNPLLDDLRRFFDVPDVPAQPIPQQSVGSGVVVDARRGYVLTNHHVVERADEITVTLADGRQVGATLIGTDAETDVALLQIEAASLTALEVGDSDTLEAGDFVVAVGNPFGLGQTVTSGIVSAVGRADLGIEGLEDFIQTDAPINPGSSGGALVDLDGRLIGLNTAILSTGGGNVGFGFAVPSNMARAVMQQLLEHGEVRRGRLGVAVQSLTPALAEALEIDVERGALVTNVDADSAAARGGLSAGDVITTFGGDPVKGSADLRNRVGLTPAGNSVVLGIWRQGRMLALETLIEPETSRATTTRAVLETLEGAELRDLTRDDPRYAALEGALVVQVRPGSPAWRSGLRPNDVIVAVNRRPIRTVEELSDALAKVGSPFALDVERNSGRLFIVVK